jgi:hypothetical protein
MKDVVLELPAIEITIRKEQTSRSAQHPIHPRAFCTAAVRGQEPAFAVHLAGFKHALVAIQSIVMHEGENALPEGSALRIMPTAP